MSANNILYITKKKDMYHVTERDVETGATITKIGEYSNLEYAILMANKYSETEEIEYGLSIKL